MVNIKDHKAQLIEMAKFYIELPKKVESDADKCNAEIGKKHQRSFSNYWKKSETN